MPDADVIAHLDGVRDAHRGLLASIDGMGDADLAMPSLLPGWTRAHVLSHVAANADSFVRIVAAASRGESVVQYEGGAQGRAAGIEAGAALPALDLVERVRASARDLESALDGATDSAWLGAGTSVVGSRIPVTEIPFRRWREVEVHHADLGLAHGWADWPARWVREDLHLQEMRILSRASMGLTQLPTPVLALSPNERLAWMFGRLTVDGAPAPEAF